MLNSLKIWVRLAVAASMILPFCAAQAADLLGVRFGPNGDKTRIVFDIMGAPEYSISGDEIGNGRLLIDFTGLSVDASALDYQAGKGHVSRYGFAPRGGASMRAVLDLGKTAKIKEAFLLEPEGGVAKHRLVIDLETADKNAFMASLPNPYPDLTAVIERATAAPDSPSLPVLIPPSPTQKEVALQPKTKLTIVIDPGHGGRDPGSIGPGGALEKSVTMAAALQLAETLKKRGGYEVVLTRTSDKDERIKRSQGDELARREALAREAGADLFISLHADAIAQSAVRGASVYTISERGAERSTKIAKSNGNYRVYDLDLTDFGEGVDDILFDLAQTETNTASSYFAETLIENLTGKTPLLNRSHRTADLRVLLAPDVPAVLLEMAFMSNAKDEANLTSGVWRQKTMSAVADAIDQYFEERASRRFAANRAGGAP